jgi:cardiolipin synthase
MLSFSRLLLVPVFLVLLINGNDLWALLVLVVSSATDFLDGFLARALNQVSRLGQLLDPAADRLYIFAALIGLAARELVPWWIVLIIIGRDVFLLLLGIVLANFGFGPLPVHQLGKVATFCLFYALPLLMLGHAFPSLAWWSQPVGWAFALWGAFLYWWAGIIYAIETVRVIRIPRGVSPAQSDTLEFRRYTVVDSDEKNEPEREAAPENSSGNTDTTLNFSQEFAAALAALDGDVTAEEQEAVAALPSGSALLVVRRGPNTGARFLLDADVTTVGRHPDADIFLDDVTVSRRHAEFLRRGTAFEVKDLGSLNGTYFDGVRIDTALLSDGAEVQVGKFRLTFYASRLDLAHEASE